jgi:hypothetical protein
MRRPALILAIVVLLAALVVGGIGCGTKEGQRPTFKVGDKITYEFTYQTSQGGTAAFDMTVEVTGEEELNGKNCYVVALSFDPPPWGASSMNGTMWIDKEVTWPVEIQNTGEFPGALPFSSTEETSYDFGGKSLWPLKVGKEVTATETKTTTTIYAGQPQPTQTETKTSTYKVEGTEEITVSAGTFQCFKIVEYDQNGEKLSTKWHSDKVKADVKTEKYETGESQELASYSVS